MTRRGTTGSGNEPTIPSASLPTQPRLIDFSIERQRHARFVERQDVLTQLDAWLLRPGDGGWVVVTGGPGMGKSAMLSAWLTRRETTGAAVPHHFVRRQVADWDQPDVIAGSLSAQLETMFPELRDPDAKPERRLIELLGRVSKHLGPSGDLVVLVDGLDETHAEPRDNPLPRILPHHVPAGIRILCAMRPTYPHLGWIEARNPIRRLDLDDKQWAASNETVVRGFWGAVAPEYAPPLPVDLQASAIERAEGNVLHAVMLHDWLRGLPSAERRVDRLPRGLKGLIGEIWAQAASQPSVREGLGLLCASREAISLDMVAELAAWSYDERERFLPAARQLLLEEPASWAGAGAYRPRHEWIRELMAERLGAAAIRAHHATLAEKLATWPPPNEATARRYALRYALTHCAEAGEWARAWRLAADLGFLETKCRELGAHETETDVARTIERCRASGDEALRRRFEDLARALGRESHWLRAAPEATAALVWNRLRQSGWSAEELDQQLHLPAGARFLRLRYLATRESPALVRSLVGHDSIVTACAVTPYGRRVVSASSDHTLKVWDLDSGRTLATLATLATLEGHTNWVTSCVVTPDGRRLVSGSADHALRIWDLDSGHLLSTLKGHTNWVTSCVVTPDGRRLVSGSADHTLKIWDLDSGRLLTTLEGHTGIVSACAVTPNGRRLVSASHDQALKVWDLDSGRLLTTLEDHCDSVTACAVTPDGRRIVSASADRTLRIWDLDSGHPLATLEGHAHRVSACAVTPDGTHVVSASWDETLRIWDLDSGHPLATLGGHADFVTACTVTPDGRHVVSASKDKTLKVWDLDLERPSATSAGHANRVSACVASPDSLWVVSASWDRTLKVWDLNSARPLAILKGHDDFVTACAVTPDGLCMVSASEDRTLKAWDLKSARLLATLEGHLHWVTACTVTQDGRRVISASLDGTLKVWDLDSKRPLLTLKGHPEGVTACAVTPDDRRAISASFDGALKVWDLNSGHTLATLRGHTDEVTACVVTADGERVISASEDKTLKVWDLNSGRILTTLRGHNSRVTTFAVTSDSRRVISASEDKTLRVWDLDSGVCLFIHHAHSAFFAVAATATAIVAGDAAGTVWFLNWPSPDPRTSPGVPQIAHPHAATPPIASPNPEPLVPRSMMKHTILFLAANPLGTDHLALDREARAIQVELERSGSRDRFELVTRWAAEPLDLLRELRKLKPTIVHFSGHGGAESAGAPQRGAAPSHRDIVTQLGHHSDKPRSGLFFQGTDGGPQFVSTQALKDTFGAAGASVQLVVLSACYSDEQAQALLPYVGCIVGMRGSILDAAARNFAIGFYGGLGERESIAGAYQQGCAAISLEGLPDRNRPLLAVRPGLDASQLVLAADSMAPPASHTGTGSTAAAQSSPSGVRVATSPTVDIGILTIRDDEFRAVLDVFPKIGVIKGKSRQYALRSADLGNGQHYTVGVLRQPEQGNGEAQDAARDLLDDLAPKLVLVVGIAGGLPSDDVKLGDVVLSTRIQDFTVEARKAGHAPTYAAAGGPIARELAAAVATLAAQEDEMGDWTAELPPQPEVKWLPKGQIYGPQDWQSELRAKLEHHYGKGVPPRAPIYVAGPIASSDRLVKDPEVLIPWLATARNLIAVEMESGGVFRALRERCPMLAIRGISDIIGLKRADEWTKYACASAAAFTRAFLRTQPVPLGAYMNPQ